MLESLVIALVIEMRENEEFGSLEVVVISNRCSPGWDGIRREH
jgi:hypothetical protein